MRRITLVTMLLVLGGIAFAQCPYKKRAFSGAQVLQLCNAWTAQQQVIMALGAKTDKVKIDMITVKPNVAHPVGKIYAVLVGGLGSGGAMVPLLPPPGGIQTVTFGLGNLSCSVSLKYNSAQDYSILHNCGGALKAVEIYSANPVTPLD